MVKGIREGFHSLTPYFALHDAAAAIAFYQAALGAEEVYRLHMPDGRVGHAELKVGDSRFMVSDEFPAWGSRSAQSFGGSPMALCIYSDDVAALADRFVKAGGKVVRPLADQFYGDRSGQFEDPEGYRWTLAQHVEDVPMDVIRERMAKMGS